jgi:hypothetical protein
VETPKRLAPTRETIRHLFALSGNRCGYPDCSHPLIDSHANFVAEVCHIEAAEPAGPRFNAAMNNEERRLPENLLLLCHRHHVETDDEQRFPVAELKKIKERHEAQFEEAVARIAESAIVDITKQLPMGEPTSLARLGEVLGWGLGAEELRGSLEEMLLPMLARLRLVAPDTRAVLLVVVERGSELGGDLSCPLHEVEQVTSIDREALREHVATLERYGLVSVEIASEDMPSVLTQTLEGWPFWRDLRAYCAKTGLTAREFLVELRFDLLD